MATSTVKLWQSTIDGLNRFIITASQLATIENRNISAPSLDSVDFDEVFTTFAEVKIAFDTENVGLNIFDGVSVGSAKSRGVNKTLVGYFEFIPGVTSEMYLSFNGRRLNITQVEDIAELNGIIKITLDERGDETKEATKT